MEPDNVIDLMTASVEHTDRLDAKIQTSTSYNKHATSLTPIKQYTFYNMSNRVIGECFIFGFVFKTNPMQEIEKNFTQMMEDVTIMMVLVKVTSNSRVPMTKKM